MTEQEAREEIPDFEAFRTLCCVRCKAEWYCPSDCDMLSKAKKLDFNKIVKSFARNDGDMRKVSRYIKGSRTS